MRRREIAEKFDEIVEFSGIAEFLDTPVKRYSSGMYVRLAFAVAAHLRHRDPARRRGPLGRRRRVPAQEPRQDGRCRGRRADGRLRQPQPLLRAAPLPPRALGRRWADRVERAVTEVDRRLPRADRARSRSAATAVVDDGVQRQGTGDAQLTSVVAARRGRPTDRRVTYGEPFGSRSRSSVKTSIEAVVAEIGICSADGARVSTVAQHRRRTGRPLTLGAGHVRGRRRPRRRR